MDKIRLVIEDVNEERIQGLETRRQLYTKLERKLDVTVISFITSFRYPVMIEDTDADMLEGLLQKCPTSKGLALVLSSPGGSGLSSERIINVLRAYSGTGEYVVIVPGKAKSAATMICLGASKIIMGTTSELGTVDPQMVEVEDEKTNYFSVYNIVKSYDDLFARAVRETGHLEPYLQQLANYDARTIQEMRSQLDLSRDMAIKVLKSGMLSRLSEKDIVKRIKPFLTPETAKVHGRPITAKEAQNCGLNVEIRNVRDSFWSTVYELYVRLNNYVSTNNVSKCVECQHTSFRAKGGEVE